MNIMKLRNGKIVNYNVLHPNALHDILILTNYIKYKGMSVSFIDMINATRDTGCLHNELINPYLALGLAMKHKFIKKINDNFLGVNE
jgi:hypothetical protein